MEIQHNLGASKLRTGSGALGSGELRRVYANSRSDHSESVQTRFYAAGTYVSPEAVSTGVSDLVEPAQQSHDSEELWRAAQDARAFFLVKRYEGKSSVEDDARFHQLTARLRRISPRITAGHIDLLDEHVTVLERAGDLLDSLRAEIDAI